MAGRYHVGLVVVASGPAAGDRHGRVPMPLNARQQYDRLLARDPFAVPVTVGAETGTGVLTYEDVLEPDGMGGQVQARRRALAVRHDQFTSLAPGASLVAGGTTFKVVAVLVDDVVRRVILR